MNQCKRKPTKTKFVHQLDTNPDLVWDNVRCICGWITNDPYTPTVRKLLWKWHVDGEHGDMEDW